MFIRILIFVVNLVVNKREKVINSSMILLFLILNKQYLYVLEYLRSDGERLSKGLFLQLWVVGFFRIYFLEFKMN